MSSLIELGVTCQVEGFLKSLEPSPLVDAVKEDLVYPGKLTRAQSRIIIAKIKKMHKYLSKHDDFYVLLNYILCIAEDQGLDVKNLFKLYQHYDPELNQGVSTGCKLAAKWRKIW